MVFQERMNAAQKELLIENMTDRLFHLQGRGACSSANKAPGYRRKMWNILAAKLNKLGPAKTEPQWRNTWRNLKNKVSSQHVEVDTVFKHSCILDQNKVCRYAFALDM